MPAVLDRGVIDEVVTVDSATAIETARQVARIEGVPVGISSGAAVAAALQVAARPSSEGKTIVIIIPSFAERTSRRRCLKDSDDVTLPNPFRLR